MGSKHNKPRHSRLLRFSETLMAIAFVVMSATLALSFWSEVGFDQLFQPQTPLRALLLTLPAFATLGLAIWTWRDWQRLPAMRRAAYARVEARFRAIDYQSPGGESFKGNSVTILDETDEEGHSYTHEHWPILTRFVLNPQGECFMVRIDGGEELFIKPVAPAMARALLGDRYPARS